MAHCKACNTEFTEKRNIRREWSELCPVCDNISTYEKANALDDMIDRIERRTGATEEQLVARWAEDLDSHKFSPGLSLRLSEEAVVAHLKSKANERFWDAIERGIDYIGAREEAIGVNRLRRNQDPLDGM